MLLIKCCQREQRPTEIKEIESKVENQNQLYLFLKNCIKCGKSTLRVITVDRQNKITDRKRIKTKNIDSFLKNNRVIRELSTIGFARIKPRIRIITSEYSRKSARNKN